MALTKLRIACAITALGTLAGVMLSFNPFAARRFEEPMIWALWATVAVIGGTIFGLARFAYPARWLGIAMGLTALPLALGIRLEGAVIDDRVTITIAASVAVLGALLGRPMFRAFEGRSRTLDWTQPRMGLVRWAVIANTTATLFLFLVALGSTAISVQATLVPAAFLLFSTGGAWLLARQMVAGILLTATGSLGFLGTGTYLVAQGDVPLNGALVLGALFGPAIVMGCVLSAVYAKPIVRYLKAA